MASAPLRVLFLSHNHPALQPGGSETVALEVFRALRRDHGVEGVFLAAVTAAHREPRPGTLLQAVAGAPDEVLVWLDHFDRFFLSQVDLHGLADLARVVADVRPDIVHVHHPLLFGAEGLAVVQRAAPRAQFVATLHDYFALCPREGQLLTSDDRLCLGPSLDGCHRCFPTRPLSDFVLRDLHVRGAFDRFDRLLVPSEFARARFVAAGWPEGRLAVLRNGVVGQPPAPHRPAPDGRRDRFAFFGHINHFKGARIALEASALLDNQDVAHRLTLHGGTAYQTDAFLAAFRERLAAIPTARHLGAYSPVELPRHMGTADWVVVPSIWWENAPLVILEAFQHRRPVICSGVGGMAEMVRDGVDGLHVPPGDARSLADAMRNAAEEPGLWDRLVANIRPPRRFASLAAEHLALYAALLGRDRRTAA